MSAHIVIIDDDPALRGTMRRILERAGYEVSEAEDGDRGIQVVASRPVPPELVITDLLMPEKEGIETIQELTDRFPSIRILAVSGAGGSEDEEGPLMDAKLFGAHAVLAKPFSVDSFLAAVDGLLVSRPRA